MKCWIVDVSASTGPRGIGSEVRNVNVSATVATVPAVNLALSPDGRAWPSSPPIPVSRLSSGSVRSIPSPQGVSPELKTRPTPSGRPTVRVLVSSRKASSNAWTFRAAALFKRSAMSHCPAAGPEPRRRHPVCLGRRGVVSGDLARESASRSESLSAPSSGGQGNLPPRRRGPGLVRAPALLGDDRGQARRGGRLHQSRYGSRRKSAGNPDRP